MEQQHEGRKPVLAPIKNGWAALGKGWAVHGNTREEALENYRKAEERHREIDARPFWYEELQAQTSSSEHSTDFNTGESSLFDSQDSPHDQQTALQGTDHK